MSKLNIVLVDWVDSMMSPKWADTPKSNLKCQSVGHLVRRDKHSICIALNASAQGGYGDFMEIPARAVTKIKKIKV